MQRGPYDEIAESLAEQIGCKALALVVIDGSEGSGMAVTAAPPKEALRLVRPLELLTARLTEDVQFAMRKIDDKTREN